MEHDEADQSAPANWLAAIERGRADLDAGRTLPAEIVLAQLQHGNERMLERLAKKATDAA